MIIMDDYTDALELKAYRDLINFIHWISHNNSLPGHWLLNWDDMEAECLLALSKCISKYLFRKPYAEFLVITRTAIRNAIGALKYKACVTHRRAEFNALSLDESYSSGDGEVESLADAIPGNSSPEHYIISEEYVEQLAAQLSPIELRVLSALLGGEPRVLMYIKMSALRRSWVYENPTVVITPEIISQAICQPLVIVQAAYDRIGELVRS